VIRYTFNDGGRADAGYKGKTGDCVVRAIAIASRKPYKEVYGAMAKTMQQAGYRASGNAYNQRPRAGNKPARNARDVQQDVLKQFGYTKVRLLHGARPTYTDAYSMYGDCIVGTTKHIAALVDGALHDIFDGRTYLWEGELHERKAQSVWVKS